MPEQKMSKVHQSNENQICGCKQFWAAKSTHLLIWSIKKTAEYPATLSLDSKRVATWYAVSDIYKNASWLSSWVCGTQ